MTTSRLSGFFEGGAFISSGSKCRIEQREYGRGWISRICNFLFKKTVHISVEIEGKSDDIYVSRSKVREIVDAATPDGLSPMIRRVGPIFASILQDPSSYALNEYKKMILEGKNVEIPKQFAEDMDFIQKAQGACLKTYQKQIQDGGSYSIHEDVDWAAEALEALEGFKTEVREALVLYKEEVFRDLETDMGPYKKNPQFIAAREEAQKTIDQDIERYKSGVKKDLETPLPKSCEKNKRVKEELRLWLEEENNFRLRDKKKVEETAEGSDVPYSPTLGDAQENPFLALVEVLKNQEKRLAEKEKNETEEEKYKVDATHNLNTPFPEFCTADSRAAQDLEKWLLREYRQKLTENPDIDVPTSVKNLLEFTKAKTRAKALNDYKEAAKKGDEIPDGFESDQEFLNVQKAVAPNLAPRAQPWGQQSFTNPFPERPFGYVAVFNLDETLSPLIEKPNISRNDIGLLNSIINVFGEERNQVLKGKLLKSYNRLVENFEKILAKEPYGDECPASWYEQVREHFNLLIERQ